MAPKAKEYEVRDDQHNRTWYVEIYGEEEVFNTSISDEEGDTVIYVWRIAVEDPKLAKAFIDTHLRAYKLGQASGEFNKQLEIRRVLGLNE